MRTPRPTTPEAIREERRKLLNFFFIVVTFDVLVITGLAGAFLVSIDAGSDTDLGLLALASLAAKLYMAIRVYRLSEAIGHRVGLRVLYAFLSILPVVYLIPLIALLTSASRRLRAA